MRFYSKIVAIVLLVALPSPGHCADILKNVPHDALGFFVVRNLAAADENVARLLRTIQIDSPAPLAFLQAATGIGDGLEVNGDCLFAVLPGQGASGSSPNFAVWIPVRDYAQFVASLHGAAGPGITAASIAGQDVLIAQHGAWALIMDLDQRPQMEQILQSAPNPPAAITQWNDWIDANEVAVVVLQSGIAGTLASVTGADFSSGDAVAHDVDSPFPTEPESPFVAPRGDAALPSDLHGRVRVAARKWLVASPRFAQLASQANAVGLALRFEENGAAIGGVRASFPAGQPEPVDSSKSEDLPPTIYGGGGFVIYGGGSLHPRLAAAIGESFTRSLVDDLKIEERMTLVDESIAAFQQAMDQAVQDVHSIVVLTHPDGEQPPPYTNEFLIARVADAKAFTEHASATVQRWNDMNLSAQGQTRLVFDSEEVKVGERPATRFALDIAAAEGAPELPEIRQAMEKLFGAGGKLQLWVVPIDERNVLLACATNEQVAAAVKKLEEKQPIDWSDSQIGAAHQLLPDQADWRVYFGPHRYYEWLKRQTDAVTGPVVGGPLVKDFPTSPPIAIAGGVRDGELWIDAAVPAETIGAASTHWRHLHRRKPTP